MVSVLGADDMTRAAWDGDIRVVAAARRCPQDATPWMRVRRKLKVRQQPYLVRLSLLVPGT